MSRKHFSVLLLLTWLYTASFAQAQVDQFLNRFTGAWQGDGKSFGMAARLEMKWEWVLENKFLRLSLRNEMRSANGQRQVFEGHAYYQPTGSSHSNASSKTPSEYAATWFDSRGIAFPIKAHAEGDALSALWGTPETEQGKSTYRILESGKMEVVDSVRQKDGTWREFGRFLVARQ